MKQKLRNLSRRQKIAVALSLSLLVVGTTVSAAIMINLFGTLQFQEVQSPIKWSTENAVNFDTVGGAIVGGQFTASTCPYFLHSDVSIDHIVCLERQVATSSFSIYFSGSNIAAGLAEYVRIYAEEFTTGTKILVLEWDSTGVCTEMVSSYTKSESYTLISISYKWISAPVDISFSVSAEAI